ncbi:MAG: PQQ-binding-like beta-propeller repeat protein [Planctomycetota bacterium]|nr:PQQ-binding-like beta-propeller repeat protein [Planctomycetota bacterium]
MNDPLSTHQFQSLVQARWLRVLFCWSMLCWPAGATVHADVGGALIPLLVGADGVIQEYRDALSRLDSGETLNGIRKLQILHEKIWGEDPLLEEMSSDIWRVARPLSAKIVEVLRSLPAEHQLLYRTEFDSRAQSVFQRALQQLDPAELLRAADLFPLTKIRNQALIAAGDLFLERDQPGLAIEAWDQVVVDLGDESESSALQLELTCSLLPRRWIAVQRAGLTERAQQLTEHAQQLGVVLPELAPVPHRVELVKVPTNPVEDGVVAWKTHNYSQHIANGLGRGRSYFPPLLGSILAPGFGKDWVAIATSRRLLRYDLRTGKLIANNNLHSGAPYFEEQDPDSRLWVSTDGSLLICSYVARASRREDYLGFDIQVSLPARGMKCWDLAGDGGLLWDTADRGGSNEMLRNSSFNSKPVIQDGKVWVLGWRKSGYIDVTLWCLDARTGEEIWSRPIVGNQVELTMFGEPAREPFLGAVLVRDGTVFCCSNLGVIAALRAWDGQVEWISEYDRESLNSQRNRFRSRRRSNKNWSQNPLVLHEGTLFVTPLDSSQLHAIDAASGSIQCQIEGKGIGPHMLGVTDGRLVLFGDLLSTMLVNDIGRTEKWDQALTSNASKARPALVEGGVVYVDVENSSMLFQPLDSSLKFRTIGSLASEKKRAARIGAYRPELTGGDRIDVVGNRIVLTNLTQATCVTQKLKLWEEK